MVFIPLTPSGSSPILGELLEMLALAAIYPLRAALQLDSPFKRGETRGIRSFRLSVRAYSIG